MMRVARKKMMKSPKAYSSSVRRPLLQTLVPAKRRVGATIMTEPRRFAVKARTLSGR